MVPSWQLVAFFSSVMAVVTSFFNRIGSEILALGQGIFPLQLLKFFWPLTHFIF